MALILPQPRIFFHSSPSFQKGASLLLIRALKVCARLPASRNCEWTSTGASVRPFTVNISANEPAAGPSCFWGAGVLKCGLHLAAI